MDAEKRSLERCREMIAQSLNWGPASGWGNLDFETLSEKVFDKTQVRLSVSTLKRIWGKVRYDSTPTLATLNVLAKFLEYESWRDFHFKTTDTACISPGEVHGPQPAVLGNAESIHGLQPTAHRKKRRYLPQLFPKLAARGSWLMIGGVLLIGAFIFLFVSGRTPETESGVIFKSRKVSDELPNSVVFTYDIGNLKADSVIIQQSWDPRRRQHVSPTGKQHTSIYYKPGYFEAKLIVNGEIKKEDVVFIKTQGWKGIIDGDPPVYLRDDETRLPGRLGITAATLSEKTGSSIFTGQWVTFSNVRELGGVNGTAFNLDVTLRNTATVEECLCRKTFITLLSKGGAIVIPLAARGCISDIGVLTPLHAISGKDHDLSAFGVDYQNFEHVRCTATDGIFRIFINDTLALEEKQPDPVGEFVGIRIAFEGTGEIQQVKLANAEKIPLDDLFRK